MQENNNRHIEENEIDLREIIRIIVKRKFFIVIFTALVTIGAVVFALSKTPIYELKAVIEIGSINNNKKSRAIEDPNNLVKRLNIMYISNHSKNANAKLTSITIVKKTTNLIELKVESISNEKAKKFLDNIILEMIEKDQTTIDTYTDLVKQQMSNLKKQKQELDKNQFDGSMVLKLNISSRLDELSLIISPSNIQKTALLGEIMISDYPIKPKKKQIVIVAFVTGLILSIFLVFFLKFIRNEKEK